MKIGRNDMCYCGSRKKYKKCCLNKDESLNSSRAIEDNSISKDEFLNKYGTIDLLQSIAGLSLLPNNHGKNIRLDQLLLEILRNFSTKTTTLDASSLKSFLNREYSSEIMEDVPVNMFTDLITFYGGDYLVFPGITENGTFVISNLLTAVFQWPYSKIPKSFVDKCRHVVVLILAISNEMANRLEYTRYQEGKAEEVEIFVPKAEDLSKINSVVKFSDKELEILSKQKYFDKKVISEFLFDFKTLNLPITNFNDNPLLNKPIIKIDGGYIIASPTTLSYALTNYIWREAELQSCMKAVNSSYHDLLWHNVQIQFSTIGFKHINVYSTLSKTKETQKEGFYKFDVDKIAYIQYVYDINENYINTEQSESNGVFVDPISIERNSNKIISNLLLKPDFIGFQVFEIKVISSTGRIFIYPIESVKNTKTCAISAFELDVLWNLNNTTALDLWKFTIARDKQIKKLPLVNFSFLDQYLLYTESKDSFYLSDSSQFDMINIQPGYAAELISKSKHKLDIHSADKYIGGKLASVIVRKKDEDTPVYIDFNSLMHGELNYLVEGYFQAVWVQPEARIEPSFMSIYYVFNDAISYWLWQIQKDVKPYLDVLGAKPLTISFDLISKRSFESIERDFEREENICDKFITSITNYGFNIQIPPEILPYLYGADNEGERFLVRNLIKGINKILALNKQTIISNKEIDRIINKNVLLGMKKKIFILDSSDNLLIDPRNLKKYKYVQEYDIGVVLDSIIPKLGKNCPNVGILNTKEEKNDLLFNVVNKALFPLLREKICLYDSVKLLKKLLNLNENLIRKREELRLQTPTRIACYISVEQQNKFLNEELSKCDRTAIATRCLIEHIGAEPSSGINPISQTAIDELIAIMSQIVDWGSLGDQIHYDLIDTKIEILPSGRIGTDKTFIDEIFKPYLNSKTSERIIDATESFSHEFSQAKSIEDDDNHDYIIEKLDKAFIEDYGISLQRLFIFMEELARIGFEQTTAFASFPLNTLREEINKGDKTFDVNEFNNAVTYLGLVNRGKVDKLPKNPKGYEFIDIMPWRYNRMLSLSRKPLIIVDDKDEGKIAYWGVRQVLLSKMYLADQCISQRIRVFENSALTKVLGDFANRRGDELVKTIINSIKSEVLVIDRDVFIGPKHSLKNDIEIGDIDVLVIDEENKKLFSLECKCMSPSRNAKEMVEEVHKLLGSDSNKGWISKHERRHQWIIDNKKQISYKYNVDISEFEVKSFFVTKEDMLTPFLKKQDLSIPFISSYEIEKEGIDILMRNN